MVELKNVVKKFGSFTAVNNLSLRVEPGQFLGFLGPNGAGKTTTIKMLTGLYKPHSGTCTVNGYDVHKDPICAKRSFGYVPDQPFLYDKLTGREFLHFVGGLFHLPAVEVKTRIDEMMDAFEIGPFIDKRSEEYSQGMRQRIVITAALLHSPQVLIIDEPIVGLDPRSARLVKDTLKRRTTEGLTIFMSTHLLEIVEELCDRIAIIKDGRVIYEESLVDSSGVSRRLNGELEEIFLQVTR